jgi:predicted permease
MYESVRKNQTELRCSNGSGSAFAYIHAVLRDQGVLWGGVGLGFIFLMTRSYIRLAVFRRLYSDDALVWAAWVMTLVNAIIWQCASGDMYLMLRVSSGASPVIPVNLAGRKRGSMRALLASYLLFYSTLWAVKLAFLVFFRKLGQL